MVMPRSTLMTHCGHVRPRDDGQTKPDPPQRVAGLESVARLYGTPGSCENPIKRDRSIQAARASSKFPAGPVAD
jgi:hypothetical protein